MLGSDSHQSRINLEMSERAQKVMDFSNLSIIKSSGQKKLKQVYELHTIKETHFLSKMGPARGLRNGYYDSMEMVVLRANRAKYNDLCRSIIKEELIDGCSLPEDLTEVVEARLVEKTST